VNLHQNKLIISARGIEFKSWPGRGQSRVN